MLFSKMDEFDLPQLCEVVMSERMRISGRNSLGLGATMSLELTGIPKDMEEHFRLMLEGLFWMTVKNGAPVFKSVNNLAESRKLPAIFFNVDESGIRVRDAERQLIIDTLDFTQGNRSWTAELLCISRPTLARKIKAYKIDVPESHGYKRIGKPKELVTAST